MPTDMPPKAPQEIVWRTDETRLPKGDNEGLHIEKMYLKRSIIFPTTNKVYGEINPYYSQYGIDQNLNW